MGKESQGFMIRNANQRNKNIRHKCKPVLLRVSIRKYIKEIDFSL